MWSGLFRKEPLEDRVIVVAKNNNIQDMKDILK